MTKSLLDGLHSRQRLALGLLDMGGQPINGLFQAGIETLWPRLRGHLFDALDTFQQALLTVLQGRKGVKSLTRRGVQVFELGQTARDFLQCLVGLLKTRRHLPQRFMELMVKKFDRKGKNGGKGFYDYPENGQKRIWPGLTEIFEEADTQPDVEELKTRLLYIQALETARCFEEQVLQDVRDADVGAIFGWGFAPYTGGPLSLIDTVSVRKFVDECERLAAKHGKRFQPSPLLMEMAQRNESFYDRFNPKAA